MRGLRSHQNLAAPEHLQFWAPLAASICVTCGYRGWFSFSQWGKCPSLKGQQTERVSVVFLSHVLLHNSRVCCCDSTLSIMKENYFLWKCLLYFFSEQPNEILHSLEARWSHGNSTSPLWFPFFSIFISSFTLPLSVTLLSSSATSLPIVLLFPILFFPAFPHDILLSDLLKCLLLKRFSSMQITGNQINWLPTWNSVAGRSEIPYQCFSYGDRTHYLWEFLFSSHLIKTFTLLSNQMPCILE